MPIKYKRNCNFCGKEYIGQGINFCSIVCAKKSFLPWNKGLTKEVDERLLTISKKISQRNKDKPNRYWLGKKRPEIKNYFTMKGKTAWNKNLTKETDNRVMKYANSQKGRKSTSYWLGKKRLDMSGESHWFWKGGITEKNHLIRQSSEYKSWRRSVYIKDEYTCQECGQKHIDIVAHHIKPFAKFPELRFDINNGIVLCRKCHSRLELSLRQEV